MLQAKAGGKALPLAIMTSDDTHQRTLDLLERNSYFGAAPGQVTLIKQEKVACLAGECPLGVGWRSGQGSRTREGVYMCACLPRERCHLARLGKAPCKGPMYVSACRLTGCAMLP